jgi:hypothetical protein
MTGLGQPESFPLWITCIIAQGKGHDDITNPPLRLDPINIITALGFSTYN